MDNPMPHWYKEKRTKKERNSIYAFLRLAKYSRKESMRMRDWSMPHITLNIKSRDGGN